VLVVEDEPSFADALAVGLSREGFRVEVAADGPEGLERFAAQRPDVVLLDVMLPGLSGVDVCRRLRACSRVPIIMVSARSSEIDMVVGLELGADDYVAKPYRLRELVARIRAVLRRSSPEGAEPTVGGAALPSGDVPHGPSGVGSDVGWSGSAGAVATRQLVAGRINVDLDRREVHVDGRPVALARKEFDLLAVLTANAGRVLTREQLIDLVWGSDYVGDTKTLDVHVKRLRGKVEDDPAHPARLLTVRGVGYKLAAA
jgi:two-component system response regulator RegX3